MTQYEMDQRYERSGCGLPFILVMILGMIFFLAYHTLLLIRERASLPLDKRASLLAPRP